MFFIKTRTIIPRSAFERKILARLIQIYGGASARPKLILQEDAELARKDMKKTHVFAHTHTNGKQSLSAKRKREVFGCSTPLTRSSKYTAGSK